MNSIGYFALLSIIYSLIFAPPALADCRSSKKIAVQKVEQISTRMRGADVCFSNRLTVQALQINIKYLDACPEADPHGEKRKNVQISLEHAMNATSVTCS